MHLLRAPCVRTPVPTLYPLLIINNPPATDASSRCSTTRAREYPHIHVSTLLHGCVLHHPNACMASAPASDFPLCGDLWKLKAVPPAFRPAWTKRCVPPRLPLPACNARSVRCARRHALGCLPACCVRVHACRFFTVEERRTKLGASWYFAYYSDAKAARNVKDAGSTVLLHNISHVSLLASSGRFVLYVSPSSTLSERAKKELSAHKDLVIEVETPERVYFLRAENRHDLLYWAAGLQHMAGLPMDVKWPTAPSTLPRAPRSVLEGRAAAGTLLPEVAAEYD
ncbi:hypothetical protein EON67_11170, partial [archaeon]